MYFRCIGIPIWLEETQFFVMLNYVSVIEHDMDYRIVFRNDWNLDIDWIIHTFESTHVKLFMIGFWLLSIPKFDYRVVVHRWR